MQASDALKYNGDFALDWLKAKADESDNDAVRKSQLQAIDLFGRFLGGAAFSFENVNEKLLSEWVSWMFSTGYAYGSVMTYLGRLSAIYGKAAKEGIAPKSDCFFAVKDKLKDASKSSIEVNSIDDCWGKLRALVLADYSKNPHRQLGKDIVLFSLYNGGLSLDRLAKYKKSEYQGSDEAVQAIVNRNAKPKNKYLFPLHQSELTPKQLRLSISSLYSDTLKSVGISLSECSPSTPIDLWAVAAMHCGFSAADIAGCVGETSGINPLYSFAAKAELTSERKTEILSRVTAVLAKDPEDWYAMQFRPYVDYKKLQARLDAVGITLSKTFYPMEEIVRRVGKKMKHEQKPVVPGLLFFKSKATTLPDLFCLIGDLAWGYRYSRGPRSPYAVIPQAAIDQYESAIGKFADTIDAYPEGTLRFEPGDTVEITSGDFAGHLAIFEKELRETAGGATRVTHRLRLTGIANCLWTVDLDPRQLSSARQSLA